MSVHIEIIARAASILAEETFVVRLLDGLLKLETFIPKLTTHVDVSSLCSHTEAHDQSTFDEFMWVMSQNLTILACSRLRFVSVDYQV